jgi:hypothetical protein
MQQNDQRVNRGELDLAWELTCGELQKAVYTGGSKKWILKYFSQLLA